ncbi:hypothetical protein [Rhizobium leguminosarum]|uniref:hypothetical protein n=1 Tax=Rhizobium leguminosarum TaxID=384 RepID=UPI001C9870D3|nr:hypothetical protein [Rhizobium leguminosarum]MBY5581830.1 hypothetical protein [Rhizobium leguminosarum]
MAKTITAYADNDGKIHSTLKSAMEADDVIAARESWKHLLQNSVTPYDRHAGRFAVIYTGTDDLLKDRKLIEMVFQAVDRANRRTP